MDKLFRDFFGDETMSERAKDLDAAHTAIALTEAVGGNPKRLALETGKSPRTARRWIREQHRSNPLFRARELITSMSDPWPALVDLIVHALRKELEDGGLVPTEWAWEQAMLECFEREQETDGQEDCVSQLYLTGRATLADLRNADFRHARWRFRRMALDEIGLARGYKLRGH